MNVPTLLRHVFLVVSFQWNVEKLIYLKSVRSAPSTSSCILCAASCRVDARLHTCWYAGYAERSTVPDVREYIHCLQ